MISHLGCWVQLKVLQCEFFMGRQRKFPLIEMECIDKVLPKNVLVFFCFEAPGISIHTALQDVISYFLKVVLYGENIIIWKTVTLAVHNGGLVDTTKYENLKYCCWTLLCIEYRYPQWEIKSALSSINTVVDKKLMKAIWFKNLNFG